MNDWGEKINCMELKNNLDLNEELIHGLVLYVG